MMKRRTILIGMMIALLASGCNNKEEMEVSQGAAVVENMNAESEMKENESDKTLENKEWEDYMASVEAEAGKIEASLEESINQLEMNMKSEELYNLWDSALNDLWSEVKNTLSEEEFKTLLEEQRAWIAEKEDAVKEAGKESEGGSIHALIVNMKAAELTEERVYELYELLK